MSDQEKDLLKVKLDQLQCHFTWAPQKENIDLDNMKQRLEDAIQFDVKYRATSYNQLAFVNCLQGNCEEAIQNLQEAEKILRENHEDEFEKRIIVTYGNRAWVNYHMGQLTEAQSYLDKLERICQQFPDASRYTAMIPEVYGEKGWALLNSAAQYYEDARECFKKALEEDTDNVEWNIGYATALSRLEWFSGIREIREPSESVNQFRRVLELDPDHAEAMVLLALKLQQFNKKEEAFTLVEQALHKSPDLPYVIRYAAKFLRKEGAVDKSLELLKKALEITPNSAFLHYQIGMCYKNKLMTLTKNPRCSDPRHPAFRQKAELIDQCKYHFKKAIELKKPFTTAQIDLAHVFIKNKEYLKAEEIYRNLQKLEGLRPEDKQSIHLQSGWFELHQRNSESNAVSHFLKGYKIKQVSKSRRLCRENLDTLIAKQLRRNPSDSEANGVQGFLHQLVGERCEAIRCFEKALELDPDNERYLSALCELRLSSRPTMTFPTKTKQHV